MSKTFVTITAALAAAAVAAAAAQGPHIVNGAVRTQPAGTPFPQAFRSLVESVSEVAWIGYAVPVVEGERSMCCFDSGTTFVSGSVVMSDGSACCGFCRLEPSSGENPRRSAASPRPPGVVRLEGPESMVVLVRVAARAIDRVRVFSEDCQLDAGGRPVRWLENVRPGDSVALLESLAAGSAGRRDRILDGAVSAIALHRDPEADAALERLVAPTQPEHVRAKVPFWLGNTRSARGLAVLKRLLTEDASAEVRKKSVFGVAQSPEPGAVDTLIAAARSNPNAAVRGEAIFWLGQKAGRKAAAAITERIENDPETAVKKRAVFALSQLPKDEGVPLLITVARTHTNPAVRKQAMFWLGQSKDPRAIDFFAEILK
jgi:hypothetical protein